MTVHARTLVRTLVRAALLAIGLPTAAAAQQPVVTTFWRTLGDTTLERLVAGALRANHDIRAADARVRGARAVRTRAALDLAPAVTMSGGYTRQRVASPLVPGAIDALPDQDLWDAGMRLSWEVDVFGRLRRSLQGQGALVESAHEDLRDVQVLLAAQVADAYFDLRGAEDRLAVAERNAENQRRTLDLTLQRLEAGRGTALDSERARAQLATTLAVVPAMRAEIFAARSRLAVLAGRAPSDPPPVGEYAPIVLPEGFAVRNADSLVRRRPDVRSAERQVAAGQAFVGAARAEYLPRIAIGGAAGYTGSTLESLGNSGTPRYTIGPVLSWPALDLGHVRADVDAARAREQEAKVRYEQSVVRALGEVETSLAVYHGAVERLRRLEEAADASERAAELARLRYEEGAADFLQVLDAERTLLDAQDRLALGRTGATGALVAVYRALGGGWPGELAAPR